MSRATSINHQAKNHSSSTKGGNGVHTGSELARQNHIQDLMKGSNAQIAARLKLALSDRGKPEARLKSTGVARKQKWRND